MQLVNQLIIQITGGGEIGLIEISKSNIEFPERQVSFNVCFICLSVMKRIHLTETKQK